MEKGDFYTLTPFIVDNKGILGFVKTLNAGMALKLFISLRSLKIEQKLHLSSNARA